MSAIDSDVMLLQVIEEQRVKSNKSDPATQPGSANGDRYLPAQGSGVKIKGNGPAKRAVPIRLMRRRIALEKHDIATVLLYIKRGAHLDTAFAVAGIPGSTYRLWIGRAREALDKLNKDEKLSAYDRKLIKLMAQVEQAQAQCEVRHVQHIADAAQAGTWQAALAFLERRFPERWAKREERDLNVNVAVGFGYVQVTDDPRAGSSPEPRSDNQPGIDTPQPVKALLTAGDTDTQDIV